MVCLGVSVEIITMTSGKTCVLCDGFTFFHRYDVKNRGEKWCCTKFPKCKAHLFIRDKMVRESSLDHTHMKSDMYKCSDGRCKAYLCVDDHFALNDGVTEHNGHTKRRLILRPSAQLITMLNGKSVVLHNGYTFYKRYRMKLYGKWSCTSFPNCKAQLNIDDNMIIRGGDVTHNHPPRKLVLTHSGRYIRI
ncbi:unnamed protein product, partial [Iphiclides podalirius]